MLRINCPWCGRRDHDEFRYGGDASIPRPHHDDTDFGRWHAYVFVRKNPKGIHNEYWQHVAGCRQWLIVERNTETHAISSVTAARKNEP
jgi:sarcosine oxidase subunit delta